MRRNWALLLLFPLGLGAGLLLVPVFQPAPGAFAVICRPSAPERLEPGDDKIVLYLGNSLVFDHAWDLPGTRPVNCAHQGMRAEELRPADLPALDPTLLVLGFGTVELVQGAAEPVPFRATMAAHVAALRARYGDAPVLLLGVPETEGVPAPGVTALNVALRELAEAEGVVWAEAGPLPAYDGVHLRPAAYVGWEGRINSILMSR